MDQATGSFTLRIVVPNPQHVLLPGMYVRAALQEGVAEQAILIPQQGVNRTPKGEPFALVVDEAGKVQLRNLTLNRALGDQWLVSNGLSPGERVMVEGMMNVRPGATVKVTAWESATRPASKAENQSLPPADRQVAENRNVIELIPGPAGLCLGYRHHDHGGGGLAIHDLPISQYPPIAPPSIAIDAFYPGASAETVENSVVQIIEQKMEGFDKLLYMSATSDASGAGRIELTFPRGPTRTSPGPRCRISCNSPWHLFPKWCSSKASRSASPPVTI